MENLVNDRFIYILKHHISQNQLSIQNLQELQELLSLSKDSIYKRLQNKVPFTFEEVAKISFRLGISLDEVISRSKIPNISQWAVLDLDTLYLPATYTEQCCDRLRSYIDILQQMEQAKKSILRCAYNFIPYSFLIPYKKLNLLWHYKWHYLVNGVKSDFSLSKMILPDKLVQLEKLFVKSSHETPRTILILDKNIFSSIINDINYFVEQDLISGSELLQLKKSCLT